MRLDAEQRDPTLANVLLFPVPTYTDADRFYLTPLGLAARAKQDGGT